MNANGIIEPLSVDCVIFGFEEDQLKILLIKRAIDPEYGKWALPGGFIRYSENIETAAQRVLEERTGVSLPFMENFGVFSEVNRFPNRRVITIAYYALIKPGNYNISAGYDASDFMWIDVYNLPELPFDHKLIVVSALKQLKAKVRYEPIGFNLLPNKFPLLSLQRLYESILNRQFDKPNFRRKILKTGMLIQLDEKKEGEQHRAPNLYSFDVEKYKLMQEKGVNFEI